MHQIPWKRAVLTLASLLAAGVLLWGWNRWNGTVDPEDPNQIVAAAVQQYGEAAVGEMQVQTVRQQGDYCAALLSNEDGTACLLLLRQDELFPDLYQVEGGKIPFPAGKLKQFHFPSDGEDSLCIVCGVDLPTQAASYQILRGADIYSRELERLGSQDLVDFYFGPNSDQVGSAAYLVDATGNPIY